MALLKRADLDGDPAVQPEVIDAAPARLAEHARGVGVVDHDRRAVLLGSGHDRGQRRDVAVHAEHPVGDDEDQPVRAAAVAPSGGPGHRQVLAQARDVGVRIDHPGRLGQAHRRR